MNPQATWARLGLGTSDSLTCRQHANKGWWYLPCGAGFQRSGEVMDVAKADRGQIFLCVGTATIPLRASG